MYRKKIYGLAIFILLLIVVVGVTLYMRFYNQKSDHQTQIVHVMLYTKSGCRYCILAKDLLERLGIAYQDIDVYSQPDLINKLVQHTGQRTVPYVFIEDNFIGGYSDLVALHDIGGLDKLDLK